VAGRWWCGFYLGKNLEMYRWSGCIIFGGNKCKLGVKESESVAKGE
jgi:hypothetical protein